MKGKYVDIVVGKAYDLWSIYGCIPVVVVSIENEKSVEVVSFWASKQTKEWLVRIGATKHVWECNLHPLTYHVMPWYHHI